MPVNTKGLSIIDAQLHNLSEEERDDILDYARNPVNGVTSIVLYFREKGLTCSMGSCHRWLKTLRFESERIKRIKSVFDDFKGVTPDEINCYIAATMAEIVVSVQKEIDEKGLDHRRIQSIVSLAKEARASAQAMNTPHSTASIKELELGHALSFAGRLEAVFEGDDIMLERIKNACKSIMIEINEAYQPG